MQLQGHGSGVLYFIALREIVAPRQYPAQPSLVRDCVANAIRNKAA
jgi:hypothetical protein